MTSIDIDEDNLPYLENITSIVTGGSSGIGWATVKLLVRLKSKEVHILDNKEPSEGPRPANVTVHKCDFTKWATLRAVFRTIGTFQLVFPNAGNYDCGRRYDQDIYDDTGLLQQPDYSFLDHLRVTSNIITLSIESMRLRGIPGSIVLTSSATSYAPEISLPVYSANPSAFIDCVRRCRSILIKDGITINAVAPCITDTEAQPPQCIDRLTRAGVQLSTPNDIALALVYSATALGRGRVAAHGKSKEYEHDLGSRWNGRVLFVNGNRFIEVEESIAGLRREWLGREQDEMLRRQQILTDPRPWVIN